MKPPRTVTHGNGQVFVTHSWERADETVRCTICGLSAVIRRLTSGDTLHHRCGGDGNWANILPEAAWYITETGDDGN